MTMDVDSTAEKRPRDATNDENVHQNPKQAKKEVFNLDLLSVFYGKIFPIDLMYDWLSYKNGAGSGDAKFFSKREFSLTVRIQDPKDPEAEAYFRFRSYKDKEAWKSDLIKHIPIKIDIGAVYNMPVSLKDQNQGANAFRPVSKELVFDIDMTDYDDIRSCCKGADICRKCWLFMRIAQRVMDTALRDDFGFKHLLWVYSGRRGIHCWVADTKARELAADGKGAVADYLHIVTGSDQNAKRVSLNKGGIHPVISRAFTEIRTRYWDLLLKEQQVFKKGSIHVKKVIDAIPDKESKASMESWALKMNNFSSEEFWNRLESSGKPDNNFIIETILGFSYPRLDINVSKGMNHLLKSPFVVHPKTGKVCVPIDPSNIDTFDPLTVPTLGTLVDELNQTNETPSLKPYLDHMRTFVTSLQQSIGTQRRMKTEMDF